MFEEMERIHVGIFLVCKDDIQRRHPFKNRPESKPDQIMMYVLKESPKH